MMEVGGDQVAIGGCGQMHRMCKLLWKMWSKKDKHSTEPLDNYKLFLRQMLCYVVKGKQEYYENVHRGFV